MWLFWLAIIGIVAWVLLIGFAIVAIVRNRYERRRDDGESDKKQMQDEYDRQRLELYEWAHEITKGSARIRL